jgi:hypothetical protein
VVCRGTLSLGDRVMPEATQLEIDPVGRKGIKARSGIQAKLAEARCTVDFVKIHPDEIVPG